MATLTISGLEELLGALGINTPIPHFPTADLLNKPLDIGRSYFAEILKSLVECDAGNAYNSIQWPGGIDSADLASILPRLSHGSDANVLAFDLMQRFPKGNPLFIPPFPEGKHLRVLFKEQALPRLLLPYILDRKTTYGQGTLPGTLDATSPDGGRMKVVIEFSSPNIASEFQGKHLRSTILGSFMSNLYNSMGWDVTKINYLGDWGKPIGLLGAGWERFGSEELFQADPAGHLLDVYHQINAMFLKEQLESKKARDENRDADKLAIESTGIFAERDAFFKRMEDGEEKAITLWRRVRAVNIDNYTKLYAQLNVTFDEYSGESLVNPETMVEVVEILTNKGLCKDSDGSLIIDLKKHVGLPGEAIIRNKSGGSTYLLRDLGAVLERERKYSFDKMIYVVANDHTTHFRILFKILDAMGMSDLAKKLQHGSFNEVSQMSKQLEEGHTLGDILQKYKTALKESLRGNSEKAALFGGVGEAATAIGITGLLSQELSAKRASNHSFDISQMTSFDSGTGPDLQYWYARLCALLKTYEGPYTLSEGDFESIEDEDHINLSRYLIQYPEVTHAAFKSLEPGPIMSYLVSITVQLSYCLDASQDEDQDEENAEGQIEKEAEVRNGEDEEQGEREAEETATEAQLMLYEATRQVLENGLALLGITAAVN